MDHAAPHQLVVAALRRGQPGATVAVFRPCSDRPLGRTDGSSRTGTFVPWTGAVGASSLDDVGQPRIETLTRQQCVALLRQAQVGRVAFTDPAGPQDGAPHVVPVAYVVDGVGHGGDVEVVVRTTSGSRLGRAAPGRLVTFEVDEVCAGSREGWSVVATGRADRETDEVRTARLAGRLQAWAPGFKTQWLRIPLEQVSGRRLVSVERVVQLPDAPAPRWREPRGWAPATRTAAEYATDFDGR